MLWEENQRDGAFFFPVRERWVALRVNLEKERENDIGEDGIDE